MIIFEAKFQELYLDNVQSMERVIAGQELTATEEKKNNETANIGDMYKTHR